jgi:hypothetical protein
MQSRSISRGAGTTLAVVLALVVASHLAVAALFVPVNSDMHVYRRYAASVATAIADGTSVAVAREKLLSEDARANGRPPPAPDALVVEYPPITVAWMAIPAIGLDGAPTPPGGPDPYATRYRLLMLLVDLLIIVTLLAWGTHSIATDGVDGARGVRQLAVYGIGGLILANLIFDRLDLVVAGLLLPSALLLIRGHWKASFVFLAVAIDFKASPLALAPLWVLASLPPELLAEPRRRLGALARAITVRSVALAAIAMALFAPFLAIEGARALDFLRFRAAQGVQIESIPASVLLALHQVGLPLDVTFTLGTFEVDTPLSSVLAAASPLLLVIAALLAAALYAGVAGRSAGRRTMGGAVGTTTVGLDSSPGGSTPGTGSLAAVDPALFVSGTVVTLLLILVTSKLLSPQYVLWVLPFVALLEPGRGGAPRLQLWFLATCVVTTAIFPYLLGRTLARADPSGDGYLDPSPLGIALLLVRNALLIWLVWLAVRPMIRGLRDGSGADESGHAARSSTVGAGTP